VLDGINMEDVGLIMLVVVVAEAVSEDERVEDEDLGGVEVIKSNEGKGTTVK